MIAELTSWVRTLLILALIGNLVDWILPAGGFRKYAGLVVGLVLTVAVLGPVAQMVGRLGAGSAVANWFRNKSGPALGQVISRQQAAEVEAVLDALPGVVTATVAIRDHRAAVVVRTTGTASANLTMVARRAVEEVMSMPGDRIEVRVVESGKATEGRGRTGS